MVRTHEWLNIGFPLFLSINTYLVHELNNIQYYRSSLDDNWFFNITNIKIGFSIPNVMDNHISSSTLSKEEGKNFSQQDDFESMVNNIFLQVSKEKFE